MGLGGFRGISASYRKIPPNPPLRKWGIDDIVVSISYENFGLSSYYEECHIGLGHDFAREVYSAIQSIIEA
jgi:hypothetical protein